MELPSVTKILSSEKLIDLSVVPKDILERASRFGSAVHKACELHDQGKQFNLDEPLRPYLEAWKKFIQDYHITIEPDEMEKRFTSSKYGFTGKPDRWPMINGKRTIVDIKSSTQMYPATELQTAAYQMLLEESGIKVSQRWGVQLCENGEYRVEPYEERTDKAVFLSALSLFNYKKRKGIK